jgi:hypothetical protein
VGLVDVPGDHGELGEASPRPPRGRPGEALEPRDTSEERRPVPDVTIEPPPQLPAGDPGLLGEPFDPMTGVGRDERGEVRGGANGQLGVAAADDVLEHREPLRGPGGVGESVGQDSVGLRTEDVGEGDANVPDRARVESEHRGSGTGAEPHPADRRPRRQVEAPPAGVRPAQPCLASVDPQQLDAPVGDQLVPAGGGRAPPAGEHGAQVG